MDREKKILFLACYVLLAGFVVLLTKPVYLLSIIIVLVPPAFLNLYWLKKSRVKILVFSVLTAFLVAPAIELSARLANVWDVQSILYRPFGLIPLENMLFAFLNFLWVLSFYEYFIDRDTTRKISSKVKILVFIYLLSSLFIYSAFFIKKEIITLNYFSIAVPLLFVPALIIFWTKPSLLPKVVKPTLFFALVFFY